MRQGGFTLVELIIALLILAMVMTLCASGFKFGTRVWSEIDTQAEHIDSMQAVQEFMRSSVSNSLSLDRFTEDEDEKELESLFLGDTDRIKYVSNSPKYGIEDYLYEYELYLDHERKQLAIRYRPYNITTNNEIDNSSSVLLDGVEDIKIEYFSGFEDEVIPGRSWTAHWSNQFALPLLIRISLTLEDQQKYWPQLVIQMRNGPYVIR